ncbi:hypothetical protein CRYUN_Cryun25bG0033000 [Craigia yunnanensis]
MGSGNWYRSIICGEKSKSSRSTQAKTPSKLVHSANEKSNGGEGGHDSTEEARSPATTGGSQSTPGLPGLPIEEIAASRIQKALRAYRHFCPAKKSSSQAERYREIQYIDPRTYSQKANIKDTKLFTFLVVSNKSPENMYGYRRQA